jgi:hypothetical protein
MRAAVSLAALAAASAQSPAALASIKHVVIVMRAFHPAPLRTTPHLNGASRSRALTRTPPSFTPAVENHAFDNMLGLQPNVDGVSPSHCNTAGGVTSCQTDRGAWVDPDPDHSVPATAWQIYGQGKLTPALMAAIEAAATKQELEDIYLPFKLKRRTKGQLAREAGLEPLADALFAMTVRER